MLTGDVYGPSTRHLVLQNLIDGLAPVHVSRYPVEVVALDYDRLMFRDSRFRDHMLAKLFVDSTDGRVTVDSERIENHKFNKHNPDFHTRTTNDMAKMRKWLRELTQPFNHVEVANITLGSMRKAFSVWADHYQSVWRDAYMHINTLDVLKDLVNYIGGAQPYSTGKLAQYATQEFRLQVLEHERRQKCVPPKINMCINPDNEVWLTYMRAGQVSDYAVDDTQVLPSTDQVPVSLKEKFSMLKMVDDGTYIDNIGVRLSYNNFWIHE
jgi:hypothetical protein